ncbi:4153_t:CDS:2 [Ambispora leptoticha]|uniref:4153_t:CDS:1 n=1 Tax=Ambispora leptoticha TaxID=144679 RepID=A0A9N9FY91_9GLOM|nr:4153_t:CDS:2 [Ambispora leptoticha]
MVIHRNRNIGSGGSSTVGAISYDNEAIKNAFRSRAEAGHSFDEDVQKLVGTFNKVAEMSGAIASLKDCSSSEEFLSHKNALLAKCNQAINEMSLTTIENEDYTASFLSPYITAFTSDLRRQMDEINGLNYEELVRLEALQLEENKIKGEIEDAYRKYNETDDPDEQEEILIATNVYDYTQSINQLISMMEGKTDPNTPIPPNTTPNSNGSGSNQTPTDPTTPSGGNKPKKSSQTP